MSQQQRPSFEQARMSKMRESLKKKYYETDGQKPLGNYKLLMTGYHKEEAFLTLGPNYLVFFISFAIINLVTILLLSKLNKHQEMTSFFFILTVVIIYFDIIWLAAALINPGIATSSAEDEGEVCEVCQANNGIEVVKKVDRFHCQECDVCIDEYETHFKFIGGCIGKNNFIIFKLLLLGIFLWGISIITIIPLSAHL